MLSALASGFPARRRLAHVLVPDALFHGRYRVIRCIKAGGMGAVYEVADEATRRRRALKVMLPGTIEDPILRERFAQEATITGGIESDHIVQVSDAGIDDGTSMPFLVMDLFSGEELGSMIARRGALPPAEVVLYLGQTAIALDKTHAASIVHRDLKPENLFITTRDDGSPCVKILDYGVAKVMVETTFQRRTAIVGTPLYMAPEQVQGDGAIGPRADVYALGHLAYTLLSGEAYWMSEAKSSLSLFVLFKRIMAGPPEPATTRAARRGVRIPPPFDAWFSRTTNLEPQKRPERATQAIAELCEALGVVTSNAMIAMPLPPPSSPRHAPPVSAVRPVPVADKPLLYADAAIANPPAPLRPPPADKPLLYADAPAPPSGSSKPPKSKAKPVDESWEDNVPLFRDPATGAYSERYLRLTLDEAIAKAKMTGTKFSIVVFELPLRGLDPTRDKASIDADVRELVTTLHGLYGRKNFLGRYGPSSLVLIVPDAGSKFSRALAKALSEKLREEFGKRKETRRLTLRLRVGAERVDPLEKSATDLIERASRAALQSDA
ncbi:protein kinase [Polyangium sp. 6x1]|uniref:protein kinase domain-containing protein n=1 Tax=Polyangium sp. 6x1 TaxID=3042689 RepID=UPI002482BF33|nr:protein kinase [Polyangium sp. 6x1]MDI1446167.1 protein kinase [Polyangium sp. 6x1]